MEALSEAPDQNHFPGTSRSEAKVRSMDMEGFASGLIGTRHQSRDELCEASGKAWCTNDTVFQLSGAGWCCLTVLEWGQKQNRVPEKSTLCWMLSRPQSWGSDLPDQTFHP